MVETEQNKSCMYRNNKEKCPLYNELIKKNNGFTNKHCLNKDDETCPSYEYKEFIEETSDIKIKEAMVDSLEKFDKIEEIKTPLELILDDDLNHCFDIINLRKKANDGNKLQISGQLKKEGYSTECLAKAWDLYNEKKEITKLAKELENVNAKIERTNKVRGITFENIDKELNSKNKEIKKRSNLNYLIADDILLEMIKNLKVETNFLSIKWDELSKIENEPTLENIIGQEDAKIAIDYIFKAFKIVANGIACETPKGIMIYGYPGTGKTMLMKAIRNEILKKYSKYVMFKELKNDDITAYVGTTTLLIIEYFEKLEIEANGRFVVLVFDEADDIVPKKDGLGAIEGEKVSGILTTFDGLNNKLNFKVIPILTTNHPKKIAPAFLRSGRVGTHILTELPSEFERLKGVIKFVGILPDVDDSIIKSVYKYTPKWTHSDYKDLYGLLVNEIKLNRIDDPNYKLTTEDIIKHVIWTGKHRKTNFELFEQEYQNYSTDHDDDFVVVCKKNMEQEQPKTQEQSQETSTTSTHIPNEGELDKIFGRPIIKE